MLTTRFGKDCCLHNLDGLVCVRVKGHRKSHEAVVWKAEHMDAFDRGVDAMRQSLIENSEIEDWFLFLLAEKLEDRQIKSASFDHKEDGSDER